MNNRYTAAYLEAERKGCQVSPHTAYVALGIDMDGKKELPGQGIAKTEGAKFWLGCLTDPRNRGLEDIFICCVDGLADSPKRSDGVPQGSRAIVPGAPGSRSASLCGHQKAARPWRGDLMKICTRPTVAAAEQQTEELTKVWDAKYRTISNNGGAYGRSSF